MSIIDFLDNYIFGPLNYFDRLEGLLRGVWYQDFGHEFAVLYPDRGGKHSRQEIEALLNHYGIDVYGRTHDANHMYFRVKRRQARWAEYLLLHAGVSVKGPPVDSRNAGYVSRHPSGWMPPPWADRHDPRWDEEADNDNGEPDEEAQEPSLWNRLNQAFDRWLDE